MEHIEELINALADALRGHNALIQVQVDKTYLLRKVGDINRLAERPKVQVVTADMSFPDWMDAQIRAMNVREGTRANHRNAMAHLKAYRADFRFSDIDYTQFTAFDNYWNYDNNKYTLIMSSETVIANNPGSGAYAVYVPDSAVQAYKTAWSSIAAKIHPMSEWEES